MDVEHPHNDAKRAWTTFLVFLRLGLTSFGGPIAHIGFFRTEFVQRRRWLDDRAYADLVALCQFLPGPASSQVGFALGYMRCGLAGAFCAWVGFTLPSAILMIGFAHGIAHIEADAAWLHGLKIAAVAVVAQALWNMGTKLCPDRPRATLAILAACLVLALGAAWIQVAVILLGLLAGWYLFRFPAGGGDGTSAARSPHVRGGVFARGALALFFMLLAGLPFLAWTTGGLWVQLFDAFYRAGSLIFGGGHVLLPLLEAETVGRGWLTRDDFLAGYGAAQALPGPLFTLAAYIGAIAVPDGPGWLVGVFCLIAILLPCMLLVLATLPHWEQLRSLKGAQAALMGANAAVVGILLAAFYDPVFTAAVDSPASMILALAAFAALQFWRFPPWALVAICALAGGLLL